VGASGEAIASALGHRRIATAEEYYIKPRAPEALEHADLLETLYETG
jgi:hypothetical protein